MVDGIVISPAAKHPTQSAYTGWITFKAAASLLDCQVQESNPLLRAQRELVPSRGFALGKYFIENAADFVCAPLVVSAERIEVLEDGSLILRTSDPVYINDGQHRCAGMRYAVQKSAALGALIVPILVFEARGIQRSQQVFTDLNMGTKVSNSATLLYNRRKPNAARDAAVSGAFQGLVEFTSSSTTVGSPCLWTLAGLHKMRTVGHSVWHAILKMWQVREQTLDPRQVKRAWIWAHNVTLQGVDHVVGQAFASGMLPETLVQKLSEIDWTRQATHWEGRACARGKMEASSRNAVLIANYIR
jgi:DNA sulfur modification protein DndB